MKGFSCALLVVCAMMAPACGQKLSKTQEQLIGKWKAEKTGTIYEFKPDGTFTLTPAKGNTSVYKYRFTDDNHIEMTIGKDQLPATIIIKDDDLKIDHGNNSTRELKRVKE